MIIPPVIYNHHYYKDPKGVGDGSGRGVVGWAWSTRATVSARLLPAAGSAATLSGRGAHVYTCTRVHDNVPCRRLPNVGRYAHPYSPQALSYSVAKVAQCTSTGGVLVHTAHAMQPLQLQTSLKTATNLNNCLSSEITPTRPRARQTYVIITTAGWSPYHRQQVRARRCDRPK